MNQEKNREKNQEKKIVQWKNSLCSWSVEQFMEAHPGYKNTDKAQGINYWPAVLTLAYHLGLEEETLHYFFEEKPQYQLADIVFSMYISRLYGNSKVEEFLANKQAITLLDVHDFIRKQEAVVKAVDDSEAVKKKEKNKEQSNEVSEVWNRFMQSVQIHEETRTKYEETIEQLLKTLNQASKKTEAAHRSKDWNRILKLEKENAVLNVQLEAEKRETKLKMQTVEKMKKMELQQLRNQMESLVKAQRQKTGFLKRKRNEIDGKEMNERERFLLNILGSNEYPSFQKEFFYEAFQKGMDLKTMQTFDKPEIDRKNFEMMKKVINNPG